MRQVSGSPVFCWHCGGQLMLVPKDKRSPEHQGKLGVYYADIAVDKAQVEHRVHADCAVSLCGDPEAEVKVLPRPRFLKI